MTAFRIELDVTIRSAREDDLDALEWFGMFTPHRAIIRDTFAAQQRGDGAMLVADARGFPVGQTWIDFAAAGPGAGLLWAVRVIPWMQGLGVGGRLLEAAETLLRARGAVRAVLGVETENVDARRLYERRGYVVVDRTRGTWTYTDPDGTHVLVPTEQWVLQKTLGDDGRDRVRERAG